MNPITRNAYNDSPRTQTPVGDPAIPYATYASWFTLDNSGSDTGSFCTVKTYSLFSDAACLTAWTDTAKVNLSGANSVDSTSTQITVGLSTGFPLQTVYLQAKTKGLVTACREMTFEVCGHETITTTNTQTLQASYYIGSGEEEFSTAYHSLFNQDSPTNCPITGYTIETSNDNGSTFVDHPKTEPNRYVYL